MIADKQEGEEAETDAGRHGQGNVCTLDGFCIVLKHKLTSVRIAVCAGFVVDGVLLYWMSVCAVLFLGV